MISDARWLTADRPASVGIAAGQRHRRSSVTVCKLIHLESTSLAAFSSFHVDTGVTWRDHVSTWSRDNVTTWRDQDGNCHRPIKCGYRTRDVNPPPTTSVQRRSYQVVSVAVRGLDGSIMNAATESDSEEVERWTVGPAAAVSHSEQVSQSGAVTDIRWCSVTGRGMISGRQSRSRISWRCHNAEWHRDIMTFARSCCLWISPATYQLFVHDLLHIISRPSVTSLYCLSDVASHLTYRL